MANTTPLNQVQGWGEEVGPTYNFSGSTLPPDGTPLELSSGSDGRRWLQAGATALASQVTTSPYVGVYGAAYADAAELQNNVAYGFTPNGSAVAPIVRGLYPLLLTTNVELDGLLTADIGGYGAQSGTTIAHAKALQAGTSGSTVVAQIFEARN
jgi:hypothetical protein